MNKQEILQKFEQLAGVQISGQHLTSDTEELISAKSAEGMTIIEFSQPGQEEALAEILRSIEQSNDFLFHGTPSDILYQSLTPQKADNHAGEHGNKTAVYASTFFRESVYYAIIDQVYLRGDATSIHFGIGTRGREKSPTDPDLVVTYSLEFEREALEKVRANDPKMFRSGWLYILDRKVFAKEFPDIPEYHCEHIVVPLLAVRLSPEFGACIYARDLASGELEVNDRNMRVTG